MTILVTGCAGFIGSHLTERLLKDGQKVIGVDLLTNNYSPELKKRNIAPALKNKNFEFHPGANLAARPGVRESFVDFKSYSRNNIEGTQAMLELAKELNIKKFVFASSSSVYGDTKTFPMKENDKLCPISPYGVTKETGERLCETYHQTYGIPVVMLRYFTVYGPRQRLDMAFMKFIKAIINNEPLVVYGDGEQTRDFTYVSDAVEATYLAGESKIRNEAINVGGGSKVTVNKVIKTLENILGTKAKVKHIENQRGDVRHTVAGTIILNQALNYATKVKLKEGLEKQVDWYKTEFNTK